MRGRDFVDVYKREMACLKVLWRFQSLCVRDIYTHTHITVFYCYCSIKVRMKGFKIKIYCFWPIQFFFFFSFDFISMLHKTIHSNYVYLKQRISNARCSRVCLFVFCDFLNRILSTRGKFQLANNISLKETGRVYRVVYKGHLAV